MGLRCTADFWTVNHPNYSFSFPSCQRFATSGSSHYPCSVADAMSCHSSDKATEASEMPKFVASPFQGVLLSTNVFWRFLKPISSLCRGLHPGKAIRPYLYGHFSNLRGTGLAHVPHFSSIGKRTTRSDLHRTEDWPYNSASRGHTIWHEDALAHGRSWITVQIPEDYFKSG